VCVPGVPEGDVRWLGHRSITTTMDLQGHLVPEAAEGPATRSTTRLASARKVPQPTNAKGSVCCPGDRQPVFSEKASLFQEAPKACLVRINAQEGDHGDASCRYRCYRGR
jgi:hypothetical protein